MNRIITQKKARRAEQKRISNEKKAANLERASLYKKRLATKQKQQNDIELIVRDACERKWGVNHKMVRYCINKQVQAKLNIDSYDYNPGIKSFCTNKWNKNFSMLHYCLNQQTTAKEDIQSQVQRWPIQRVNTCKGKWGLNYTMVLYCLNK